MENNEANRWKLARAVWDSLSLTDLQEYFIGQTLERYKTDPDAFEEDCAVMGFDDKSEQAVCVHCDESHDLDADHKCKDGS